MKIVINQKLSLLALEEKWDQTIKYIPLDITIQMEPFTKVIIEYIIGAVCTALLFITLVFLLKVN